MSGTCAPTRVPHRHGRCDWCGHDTIVYAYALWICGVCLVAPYGRDSLDDRAQDGDRQPPRK